jgi:hypothetical protein
MASYRKAVPISSFPPCCTISDESTALPQSPRLDDIAKQSSSDSESTGRLSFFSFFTNIKDPGTCWIV